MLFVVAAVLCAAWGDDPQVSAWDKVHVAEENFGEQAAAVMAVKTDVDEAIQEMDAHAMLWRQKKVQMAHENHKLELEVEALKKQVADQKATKNQQLLAINREIQEDTVKLNSEEAELAGEVAAWQLKNNAAVKKAAGMHAELDKLSTAVRNASLLASQVKAVEAKEDAGYETKSRELAEQLRQSAAEAKRSTAEWQQRLKTARSRRDDTKAQLAVARKELKPLEPLQDQVTELKKQLAAQIAKVAALREHTADETKDCAAEAAKSAEEAEQEAARISTQEDDTRRYCDRVEGEMEAAKAQIAQCKSAR
mmetsp:Transcript_17691/g.38951  ORF Transcript_17691/g.38951 Transcript_17691/m.38951 type:complete len:309 (-) Transcript_17691:100-1026(-)